jgi:hypothetical protein
MPRPICLTRTRQRRETTSCGSPLRRCTRSPRWRRPCSRAGNEARWRFLCRRPQGRAAAALRGQRAAGSLTRLRSVARHGGCSRGGRPLPPRRPLCGSLHVTAATSATSTPLAWAVSVDGERCTAWQRQDARCLQPPPQRNGVGTPMGRIRRSTRRCQNGRASSSGRGRTCRIQTPQTCASALALPPELAPLPAPPLPRLLHLLTRRRLTSGRRSAPFACRRNRLALRRLGVYLRRAALVRAPADCWRSLQEHLLAAVLLPGPRG